MEPRASSCRIIGRHCKKILSEWQAWSIKGIWGGDWSLWTSGQTNIEQAIGKGQSFRAYKSFRLSIHSAKQFSLIFFCFDTKLNVKLLLSSPYMKTLMQLNYLHYFSSPFRVLFRWAFLGLCLKSKTGHSPYYKVYHSIIFSKL